MKMSRRYPGVSPFTADQGNIFFGRDNDIQKLTRLILLRKQVLLYSKSGLGKSSLLNAGVIPKLENKFTIIPVRLFAFQEAAYNKPVDSIISSVNEAVKSTDKNQKDTILKELEGEGLGESLWYKFKQLSLEQGAKEFIIVFDQFEELFTYPEEFIRDFKNQIYELTKVDVPDRILNAMAGNIALEDHEDYDELLDRLKLKLVFVIRSDRLNLLNKLTDRIPDIQKIYYELEALDEQSARQAITHPAEQDSSNFEVAPFTYEDAAVDSIIEALKSNDDNTIETTQLQIVCQTIEDIALQKQRDGDSKVKISVNDLPDFKDIFLSFYHESVGKTNEADKARIFIEDHLIRNGQRVSLDSNICLDHVSEETLTILQNAHLLRAEQNNVGGKSYELSHDSLLEPILELKKIRKEEDALKEKEKKRHEKLKLEREKQAKRIKRIRFRFFGVTAVGIVLFVITVLVLERQRVKEKAVADQWRLLEAKAENDSILANLLKSEEEKALLEEQTKIEQQQRMMAEEARRRALEESMLSEQRAQMADSLNAQQEEALDVYRRTSEMLRTTKAQLAIEQYRANLYEGIYNKDISDRILSADENSMYGFINKKGKVKIQHQYEKAEPFNLIGLARVEKGGKEYFLDIKGNEYEIVADVSSLTSNVLALDLSGKNLRDVPAEVFNNKQLKILIIADNNLRQPGSMESLSNLLYLDISGNRKLTDDKKKILVDNLGDDVNILF